MLNINYTVYMNGNYMNNFTNYTDACEFADNLERRYPKANITIEDTSFYEQPKGYSFFLYLSFVNFLTKFC